jgi:hypothetical protein
VAVEVGCGLGAGWCGKAAIGTGACRFCGVRAAVSVVEKRYDVQH